MPFLIKVHGSLDWHWLKQDGSPPRIGSAKPCTDVDHSTGPNGGSQHSIPWMPRLLMGTHNKMFDYTLNPYRELVVGMSRALAQTHSVIVAGYGFHDKAINSQLIGWFYANSHRRLVVVNPGFDDLKKQASPAIRRLLNNSKELDHLKLIENRFENVSWDEIVKYI